VTDTITFYTDEQFPLSVVRALRERGVDILTTQEAHHRGAADEDQLRYAADLGRVFVSHDADFLRLHAGNYPHTGIIYVQQGTQVRIVIEELELIAGVITAREMIGQLLFIPM
jgi:predicted nuclease of predicted toxin-antitoxin system